MIKPGDKVQIRKDAQVSFMITSHQRGVDWYTLPKFTVSLIMGGRAGIMYGNTFAMIVPLAWIRKA